MPGRGRLGRGGVLRRKRTCGEVSGGGKLGVGRGRGWVCSSVRQTIVISGPGRLHSFFLVREEKALMCSLFINFFLCHYYLLYFFCMLEHLSMISCLPPPP